MADDPEEGGTWALIQDEPAYDLAIYQSRQDYYGQVLCFEQADCANLEVSGYEFGKVNADPSRYEFETLTDSEGRFQFWAPTDVYLAVYMSGQSTQKFCWQQEAHRLRTDKQGTNPLIFRQSGYSLHYRTKHAMAAILSYSSEYEDREVPIQMYGGREKGYTCLEAPGVWTLTLEPQAMRLEQDTFQLDTS